MKVLVIVDVQNDFVSGSLGTKEAQAIIPKVVEKINTLPEGSMIVQTFDTHTKTYLNTFEGKRLPVEHCIYNTFGHKAPHEVIKACNDNIFTTYTIMKNKFGSEEVLEAVRHCCHWRSIINYDEDLEIEVIGLCTDICVISNVLLLRMAFPSTPITVDSACCAGTTPEKHAAALEVMKSCMIDVI